MNETTRRFSYRGERFELETVEQGRYIVRAEASGESSEVYVFGEVSRDSFDEKLHKTCEAILARTNERQPLRDRDDD